MTWTWFEPKPGRFGTQTILLGSGQIGGANYLGGASPLTANSTTTFQLPPPPVKSRFLYLAASVVTVPVDADGTVLARAMKYDGTAAAQVQVSADLNLGTLTAHKLGKSALLSTATLAAPIFNGTTDGLEINVVSNSAAIDTQPAGLVFTVALLVLQ